MDSPCVAGEAAPWHWLAEPAVTLSAVGRRLRHPRQIWSPDWTFQLCCFCGWPVTSLPPGASSPFLSLSPRWKDHHGGRFLSCTNFLTVRPCVIVLCENSAQCLSGEAHTYTWPCFVLLLLLKDDLIFLACLLFSIHLHSDDPTSRPLSLQAIMLSTAIRIEDN